MLRLTEHEQAPLGRLWRHAAADSTRHPPQKENGKKQARTRQGSSTQSFSPRHAKCRAETDVPGEATFAWKVAVNEKYSQRLLE
ncbi:hypothetical protein NU688_30520 [Variovorax sp. ZS18.2.2]|uniref:hypothetical protein n=1 Tax=Variovorax sp. ZS18.2.2 TaxID=2971255 RepID=UPI002151A891|nr:hypothetical protein [Variovorax sp. ZS18.2.2]MCR6480523.1 hypothetical protein [Variovorax sp. ZS18.2.2]